jgi:undecaprenyl-diphosphatase
MRRVRDAGGVDLIYSGVAVVAIACFVFLTVVVLEGRTAIVDRELIVALRAGASPVLTSVMLAVTFTSGRLAIFAAALFACLLYRRDGSRAAWYYVAACATTQVLNFVLKYEFQRARPHGISPKLTAAGGPSYPSADVMMSVVIFGLATLLLTRTISSRGLRLTLQAAALVFIVAASSARIYLGAHWPSDVLGGILAGIACSAIWPATALRRGAHTPSIASTRAHRMDTRTS